MSNDRRKTVPIRKFSSDGPRPEGRPDDAENEQRGADETPEDELAHFDAVRAAAEFTESLGIRSPEDAAEHTGQGYTQMLEEEIERLGALVDEKDQAARAAAVRAREAGDELERAKERVQRDAARELQQRERKLLSSLLEVLDDLDRAIKATHEMDHNPQVLEGIELVHKSFLRRLGEHGVVHRPVLGHAFDPQLHDAVAAVPVTDPSQNGVVIGVVQEGYDIGGDVLRPAKVAVGKLS